LVAGLATYAAPKAPVKPAEPTVAVGELPPNVVAQHIVLSYIDPKRCIDMLKAFGYRIIEAGQPVDAKALPAVMMAPSTKFSDLPNPKKTFPQTETDPVANLLVFYDTTQPDQLSHLLQRIRTVIDTPARQIMIEAMVLEISSGALAQLGVQWDLDRSSLSSGNWLAKHTTGDLRIGQLVLPDGTDMANPTVTATLSDVFGHFEAQLKALVVDQSARILSRPSILTLDNRMAYINVSEKIPVAESKFSGSNYFTQVSFREVTAGIELTVRPRVSEDGSEIGMQISASVSARKPGEDVVVYGTDSKGNQFEVARSPTLTVREVQTFARVANSTPFIIGGLIAEDDQDGERRVPFLGKLPLVGGLFRSKQKQSGRREVIIVITPNVLPDKETVARTLPKDTDDFDSFGAKLFRDAYRIRAEDVFNLEFLTKNRQLRAMQDAADRAVADHQQLSDEYPFSSFYDRRIPGEDVLVSRQIYEVVKRRGIEEPMDDRRLIFLTSDKDDAEVGVGWLARRFKKLSMTEPGLWDPFDPKAKHEPDTEPTKALALTFTEKRDSDKAEEVFMEPVPELTVVDCPSRDAWEDTLWQMNQPTEAGRKRFTILIRDQRDVTRLKRAIVVRKALELNSEGRKRLTLGDFAIGRILLMPTVKEDKTHLIDMAVAQYFFYTDHYYQAVVQKLDAAMNDMSKELQKPEYKGYRETVE
jgi:Flp pilus assembly secretin CpaC